VQTRAQITFEAMPASDSVREAIAEHIEQLEERFGRITACRISVKAPSERHRNGGLYQVRIHLALPNKREVNIDRTPSADERLADLRFAVNEAFHRARRQLQDQVRELQGQTKTHVTGKRATPARRGTS
jgi:ribosome-associated translation inhibitor RaiA